LIAIKTPIDLIDEPRLLHQYCDLPRSGPPALAAVVDTEEEFDWSAPFDRASRSVRNIAEQHHAQAIFEDAGIIPTYVIDYPVAATPESAAVFRDWTRDDRCLVGAHLHPWVNPPDEEKVTTENSYPGNLPAELEHRHRRDRVPRRQALQPARRPRLLPARRALPVLSGTAARMGWGMVSEPGSPVPVLRGFQGSVSNSAQYALSGPRAPKRDAAAELQRQQSCEPGGVSHGHGCVFSLHDIVDERIPQGTSIRAEFHLR
jgi:hypothetical protein